MDPSKKPKDARALELVLEALNSLTPKAKVPWAIADRVITANQSPGRPIETVFGSRTLMAAVASRLTPRSATLLREFLERDLRWLAGTYRYNKAIQPLYNVLVQLCSRTDGSVPAQWKWLYWVSSILWRWPRTVRRKKAKWKGRVRRKLRRPLPVDDLLDLCKVDYHRLLLMPLGPIRTPHGIRGLHRDPDRNLETGYVIALDLIVTADKLYVLEANLNGAIRADRNDFFPVDPIAKNIVAYADSAGFAKVRYVASDWVRISHFLIDSFPQTAPAKGIDIAIYQDARRGAPPAGSHLISAAAIPDDPAADCLTARHKKFKHGADYLVADKYCLNYLLAEQVEKHGAQHFAVSELTAVPAIDLELLDRGLPNLVYKYPEMDHSEGVYFLRADSVEAAREYAARIDRDHRARRSGLFQCFTCSELIDGRRLFGVRSFVFISPAAVVYCGAQRMESIHSLPRHDAMGIVEDKRPYAMNRAFGNDYFDIGPEAERARLATIELGEALRRAINERFKTYSGAVAPCP